MSMSRILEELGAPAAAISWAAEYGGDVRLAWKSCEHPELMLPLAAGVGVPVFDVINAALEVVRVHLLGIGTYQAAQWAMTTIERFICAEAVDDDVVEVLEVMAEKAGALDEKFIAQRSAYAAISHLGQAALYGCQCEVELMMSRLSTSVMLAGQARSETVAKGSSEAHKARVVDQGLKGGANLVRRYIPYESVAGGLVGILSFEEQEVYRA